MLNVNLNDEKDENQDPNKEITSPEKPAESEKGNNN